MIQKSTDGKTRVLSLSYGKDSLACLGAIEQLGLPLDRIIHAEVWATDTISADLPPMVEFKKKADDIIKERYGIEVEHFCALNKDGTKRTFENEFYKKYKSGKKENRIQGFPINIVRGQWCNALKVDAINKANKSTKGCINYIGIAVDETERVERHKKKEDIVMPLVEIGWTEQQCKQWCIDNDLLSPIYQKSNRGGCWFCPFQNTNSLREVRKDYQNLWKLLLKWDKDSPITFHADGHTVHDFEERFQLEDDGYLTKEDRWQWKNIDNIQMTLFQEENKRV